MVETYFIDWELMDKEGKVLKWINSVIKSDGPPLKTFNEAREDLLKQFSDSGIEHIRARQFNKV